MKNYIILIGSAFLFILSGCSKTPKTDEQKVAYAMGYNNGSQLKNQGLVKDINIVCQGLKEGFQGKQTKVKQEDVMASFQTLMKGKQERDKVVAEENKTKGVDFLEKNKEKEGVKTTESGLQYKVIKEGEGKAPQVTDKVKVHYKGRLMDGKEFDSSYKRNKPAEFALNAVIAGWKEGITLMKEGGKYELYIPSELGYGERSLPNIPPNSVLVFEVELLEVMGGKKN